MNLQIGCKVSNFMLINKIYLQLFWIRGRFFDPPQLLWIRGRFFDPPQLDQRMK